MTTQFHCPHCSQLLSVAGNTPGMLVGCPACGQPVIAHVTLPITIPASPRALISKYIRWGLALLFAWAISLWLPRLAVTSESQLAITATALLTMSAITFSAAVAVTLDYLRIRHTRYTIHRNKVEASSYLFRWLGITNSTINLKQLRQIQAFHNSYLDLWFFHCGSVIMTVSGDITDMQLHNLHHPSRVKRLLEQVAFGGFPDQPASIGCYTDNAEPNNA